MPAASGCCTVHHHPGVADRSHPRPHLAVHSALVVAVVGLAVVLVAEPQLVGPLAGALAVVPAAGPVAVASDSSTGPN